MSNINQLKEVIRAALDCPSHFTKPDLELAWKDRDYSIDFDASIIVCEQCVNRMRDALGLKPGDPIPLSHELSKAIELPGDP